MEILSIKDVMTEYGISRKKATELFDICKEVPRRPRGKRMVQRNEFERILKQ